LKLLALELARSADPEFVWLEIWSPEVTETPVTDDVLQQIPDRQRLMVLPPEELQPERPQKIDLHRKLLHAGRSSIAADVANFLRLPESIQTLATELRGNSGTRILVAANADQLMQYYPPVSGATQPFLEALHREGIGIIVTLWREGAQGRADRTDFDFVAHFEPANPRSISEGFLELEKSPSSCSLRLGELIPIELGINLSH
jgi:hypothetical protein